MPDVDAQPTPLADAADVDAPVVEAAAPHAAFIGPTPAPVPDEATLPTATDTPADEVTGDAAPPSVPPVEPAAEPDQPPREPVSMEQRLVRALMWVAAIALVLGVAYLVKVSFDRDLIAPAVRLTMGGAFGVALIVASEWARKRSTLLAQPMSAGGVAALFAVLLAGVQWYELIPPIPGFLLMGLVTAAAVLLSLRHGMMVAIIGLIGGFATPALIGPTEYPPALLFSFLFLLEAGLIAVTRQRRWWLLTTLTLLGGYGWVAIWMLLFFEPSHSLALGAFLAATAAAFVVIPTGLEDDDEARRVLLLRRRLPISLPQLVRWAGAAASLVLMALVLGVGAFQGTSWGFLAVLGAGAMVLARLDRRSFGLAWMAAALGVTMLVAWWLAEELGRSTMRWQSGEVTRFTRVVIGYGLLCTVGPYVLMRHSPLPRRWSLLTATSAIAYCLV